LFNECKHVIGVCGKFEDKYLTDFKFMDEIAKIFILPVQTVSNKIDNFFLRPLSVQISF
jgi:hypothetical protein